ncbi:signal peptidase II [Virgisporangium ochraceum]|uniref:signal peptidase II n=1 Tax=Virgisporangium ochraceum TaxID=65505 RepID=UPI001EF3342C|nr:signal peptidase II [Virgisporangium ochraceum]
MAQGSTIDRRRVLALFLGIALAVTAIDQITKHLTVVYLDDREPVKVLGGLVYLMHVRNSGAAFSMGTGVTWVFPIVALVVLVVLGFVIRNVRSTPWAVALGLVLGGVIGNLGDRLFRSPGPFMGHVVDMVSLLDERGRGFPVFNGADSALTIGVAFIILLELTGRQRDGTRLPSRAEQKAAEQKAAEEKAAEQKPAERKPAEETAAGGGASRSGEEAGTA